MSGHSKSRDYDAIVVGARAAGAATAMLLARRGLSGSASDEWPHSYGATRENDPAFWEFAETLDRRDVLPSAWRRIPVAL